MRNILIYSCLCLFFGFSPVMADAAEPREESSGVNLYFCSQEQGRELISASGKYVEGMHRFDLVSRLSGTGFEVSYQGYLDYAEQNVADWSEEAKAAVSGAVERFREKVERKGLRLPFPDTVRIVASRMGEEGGAAGYTRATEIYLDPAFCERADEAKMDYLLVHEMFHILTRHSPEFRKRLYACIGFTVADREVEADEELLDVRISNPDVNSYDNWAYFTIDGQPRRCTIWLYAAEPYAGGEFFRYATVGLLELDEQMRPVRGADGKPLLHPLESASDFYEKVGRNTSYVLNAEEIMADNFSMAVNYAGSDPAQDFASPRLIEDVLRACRGE